MTMRHPWTAIALIAALCLCVEATWTGEYQAAAAVTQAAVTPVAATGRINLGGGVSAEGTLWASAASILSRIVAAEGMAKYLRLIFASSETGVNLPLHPKRCNIS